MSTRSVIVVTGKTYSWNKEAFTARLWKHSDGYPSENLKLIADALSQTKKVAKEHTDRFNEKLVYPATLALGKLIGACTSFYGIGAVVEEEFAESYKPSHFGNHGDAEWLYLIDLEKRDVSIFECSGDSQASVKKGVSDPYNEVKGYYENVQERCKAKISDVVNKIVELGFTFNGRKTKKKAAKASAKSKKLDALKCKKDEKSKSPKSKAKAKAKSKVKVKKGK